MSGCILLTWPTRTNSICFILPGWIIQITAVQMYYTKSQLLISEYFVYSTNCLKVAFHNRVNTTFWNKVTYDFLEPGAEINLCINNAQFTAFFHSKTYWTIISFLKSCPVLFSQPIRNESNVPFVEETCS